MLVFWVESISISDFVSLFISNLTIFYKLFLAISLNFNLFLLLVSNLLLFLHYLLILIDGILLKSSLLFKFLLNFSFLGTLSIHFLTSPPHLKLFPLPHNPLLQLCNTFELIKLFQMGKEFYKSYLWSLPNRLSRIRVVVG